MRRHVRFVDGRRDVMELRQLGESILYCKMVKKKLTKAVAFSVIRSLTANVEA